MNNVGDGIRILRVARLDVRASVPPLTRPPPPGVLPLGSSSRESFAAQAETEESKRGVQYVPYSVNNETVVCVVHGQQTAALAHIEQTFCNGVPHQLFYGIAHRASAQLRMKSLSHEERQHGLVEF